MYVVGWRCFYSGLVDQAGWWWERGVLLRVFFVFTRVYDVFVLGANHHVWHQHKEHRSSHTTQVPMSTFMQLMEGKRAAGVVESVRISKTGTMFFKMDGQEVGTPTSTAVYVDTETRNSFRYTYVVHM